MRRQRYLRASSAQSLCIFCACRLAGDLPPALSSLPRRSLNTGKRDRQQAEAVASSSHAPAAQQPRQQYTFDPNSSLSRSEQEERNRLRQARGQRQREEEERVRTAQAFQQAQEDRKRAQQKRQEAKAREEQAARDREAQERVRAQWKQSESRNQQSKGAVPSRHINAREGNGFFQKRLDLSGASRDGDQTSTAPVAEAEKQGTRRLGHGQQKRAAGRGRRQAADAAVRDGGRSAQGQQAGPFEKRGVRHDFKSSQTSQSQQPEPARLDNPFASAAAPARAATPSFGPASKPPPVQSRPATDGWGAGPVKRAPVQYSETRPAEFTENASGPSPFDVGTGQQTGTTAKDPGWPKHETRTNPNMTTNDDPPPDNDYQASPFEKPHVPQRRRSQPANYAGRTDPLPARDPQHREATLRSQPSPPQPSHGPVDESTGLPYEREYQSRQTKVPDFVATLQQAEQRKTQPHGGDQWPRSESVPAQRPPPPRSSDDTTITQPRAQNDYRPGVQFDDQREYRPDIQSEPPRSYQPGSYPSLSAPNQAQAGADRYAPRSTSRDDRWDDAEERQRGPRIANGWTDRQPVPGRDSGPITQNEPQRQYEPDHQKPLSVPVQSRSRVDDNSSSDTNTGYRATMLDSTEYYQQPEPQYDEAQASQWQHLRRRDSAPAQSAPSSQPQQQAHQSQQEQQPLDGDWIDRSFRQHQQERSRALPAFLDTLQAREAAQNGQSLFQARDAARLAQTKCGRCHELGHVARDCTTPDKRVCYKCGQAGHLAGQCPNPAVRDNRESQGGKRGDVSSGGTREYEPAVRQAEAADRPRRDDRNSAPEDRQRDFGRNDQRRGPREDDVRQGLIGRRRATTAEAEGEPEERVLRSRKFAEKEEPAKKRGGRRRDEDEDEDEGGAERDERNARKAARKAQKAQEKVEKAEERKARRTEQGPPINLPEFVSVATLAQQLGVRYESFVSRVERLGYDDVFPGKILNAETSGMIAMEYGFEPVFGGGEAEEVERDLRARPEPEEEDRDFLPTRPPVVTIMGHVDHGKTTLLDFLRKTRVVDGEAGGITQHIGAFSVEVAEKGGKTVTFLDTPGHAAFLAMRQRGANVTDIVILVVAADDGVKPQTIEAIRCAKTAGVPILVAVNKIDKEGADVERVKGDLARHGVVVEEFGGDVVAVPVSGKTGEGVTDLVEAVVVSAEILDKRAEADGMVEGWVLEGTTKKAGRMATVLVKRGTLKPGSIIVAGKTWSRVRTLRDQSGKIVPEVGPGMPVEVDGWKDQPVAGDEVLQAETEQKATDVVDYRLEKEEQKKTAADTEAINEARRLEQERVRKEKAIEAAKKAGTEADYFEAAAQLDEPLATEGGSSGHMTVPLIIKADVSGSAEAVSEYVLSLSSPLITPQILQSTVGPINQSDIDLASAAQGHIIAFNLPPDEGMKGVAERVGVKVLENNVIYRVLDDVKAVLEEKLPPIISTRVLGEAEVGVAFEIGVGGRKKVKIAGCKVRNGVIGKGSRAKVMRGGVKVYDGIISSLKNVKKDVQEMRKGTECGVGFDDWEGFEVGDQVQMYEEISEKRRL